MNHAAEEAVAKRWVGDRDSLTSFGQSPAELPTTHQLPFKLVKQATRNFASDMRIGGGGSCAVYSAVVYGVPVAVKALKETKKTKKLPSRSQSLANFDQRKQQQQQQSGNEMELEKSAKSFLKQFIAEMELLMHVRHPVSET
jgi:hypothetical protein